MLSKASQKVVKLLMEDEKFRSAFYENPEKALSGEKLSLQPEEVQLLLAHKNEDVESIKKELQKVAKPAPAKRCVEVQVLCACGSGYWAQQ